MENERINNLILFGAGKRGREALKRYGKDKVAYFGDNNEAIVGTFVEGVKVISFSEMKELYEKGYTIMITPNNFFMIGQLEQEGIEDYLLFVSENGNNSPLMNNNSNTWWDKVIDEYVNKCKELDLLSDISRFKKLAKDILLLTKEYGTPYRSGRLWEASHYGNLQALVDYAQIDEDLNRYSPLVSHIECVPVLSAEFYKEATVMSGEYYKHRIHKRYPYVPVFSVGPYIYYASGIYSNSRLSRIKKEIGRMLLVFLPHSEEFVSRLFNKNSFIDAILKKYKNDYDSIWLCAFWVDINDGVCTYAEEQGIHVVTAGFRFDNDFDKRLKTIIELSDNILCADIGTFIPYSLLLKKPISRMPIEDLKHLPELEFEGNNQIKDIQLGDAFKEFENGFKRLFNDEFILNKEQYNWLEPYAGFSRVRNKEYIKNIFNITRDIILRCEELNEDYPAAVRNVYYYYNKKDMIKEMIVLKSAVGGYID